MEYPKQHRQIVEDLTDGKFILSQYKHFEELKQNEEFYSELFKVSFDYNLIINQEFAYLISNETNETLSRDISIFFAILCYELDKEAKNFLDDIQYSEFSFEDIDRLFESSSYIELIKSNSQLKDSESRRKLVFTSM